MKILALLLLISTSAFAVEIGNLAPAFVLPGASGKNVSLTSLKGKVIVLEWLNHGCPFVKKHYGSNNMQTLQAEAKSKGVVWLSIISSAKGKQGHVDQAGAKADMKTHGSNAADVLIDEDGTVGKAYGAKSTPHMFVIDAKGRLAYQGAIDDKPSTEQSDVKGARNFVRDAVDSLVNGQKIMLPETKAYGCGVKYE
ncbi:MAG: thioredoxin family protein [Bacteriovoracaceae bacterium]|nr:thioredoxin family protein [Bacteriovoracaceae bacterium]